MKLNDFFDKIYCINLDRRPDRWEQSQIIFNKFELNVERFSAFDGNNLITGYGKVYDCELAGTISHTTLIKKCLDLNLKNVLILEDDVEFHDNIFEKFNESILELPDNWDLLFFGGNHVGGFTQFSKNLIKLNRSYALQCYGVNNTNMEFIYKKMISYIGYTLTLNYQNIPSVAADYYMAFLHNILNVYSIYPNVTYQRESFSDIQHHNVNYEFLK